VSPVEVKSLQANKARRRWEQALSELNLATREYVRALGEEHGAHHAQEVAEVGDAKADSSSHRVELAAAVGRRRPLGGIMSLCGVDFSRPGYGSSNLTGAWRGSRDGAHYTVSDAVMGINVATSRLSDGTHVVALDIDAPVEVYPSSTPGHFHLYINKPMPWDDYLQLLSLMAKVGLLEPGFVLASIVRGFSALRLPWVKKERKVVDDKTAVQAAMDPA
jgi:hypothetical protein